MRQNFAGEFGGCCADGRKGRVCRDGAEGEVRDSIGMTAMLKISYRASATITNAWPVTKSNIMKFIMLPTHLHTGTLITARQCTVGCILQLIY